MFFQTERNLKNPGRNTDPVRKIIAGKNEKETVYIMMDKISSPYGSDSTISDFLAFVRKHRKEVFMCLEDSLIEKASDKAEQHFSIISWLLKHRFKTNEGLLRTSYWYHRYLSTGN